VDTRRQGTARQYAVCLATDIEAHFVAIYEDGAWVEAGTSEPIDSHITHWMELPEVPNE
jgi:hypothetical protein